VKQSIKVMLAASLVFALLLGGCGYSHQTLYPRDVATVNVKIFGNRTFYQGIEFDLTEALIKEMELRTPYKAVSGSGGDTVLEGEVVEVAQTSGGRSGAGGLIEELEVRVTVDFTWRDARSGQVLRERHGVSDVGHYKPADPVGEPFEVAQHQAVERMASRIVATLRDGL
jgi:hypothetical protein